MFPLQSSPLSERTPCQTPPFPGTLPLKIYLKLQMCGENTFSCKTGIRNIKTVNLIRKNTGDRNSCHNLTSIPPIPAFQTTRPRDKAQKTGPALRRNVSLLTSTNELSETTKASHVT